MAAARLCEAFATRPDLVANGEDAIAVAERLLALGPLREDWQRAALTLYARYRGKSEALTQAKAFAVLQRELAVEPEKETRALIARIESEEIAPPVRPAVETPALAAVDLPVEPLPDRVPPLAFRSSPIRAIVSALAIAALVAGAGLLGMTHYRRGSNARRASSTRSRTRSSRGLRAS
jgi:hypothetical protein